MKAELPAFVLRVWAGLLVGVSFVATPAKFLAPSVPLANALQVGSATFGVFRWVELALWCICLSLCLRTGVSAGLRWLVLTIGGVLLFQYFVLLPVMNTRVVAIVAGQEMEASSHHIIYVALEFLELMLLLVGVAVAARQTSNSSQRNI